MTAGGPSTETRCRVRLGGARKQPRPARARDPQLAVALLAAVAQQVARHGVARRAPAPVHAEQLLARREHRHGEQTVQRVRVRAGGDARLELELELELEVP